MYNNYCFLIWLLLFKLLLFYSVNLSTYITTKTVGYLYQPLYVVLNILALLLFATSIVGILKVIRKLLANKIFGRGKSVQIYFRSQNEINHIAFRNPKNIIQMKKLKFIPNVYDSNLEPPNQYQCKVNSPMTKPNCSVWWKIILLLQITFYNIYFKFFVYSFIKFAYFYEMKFQNWSVEYTYIKNFRIFMLI